MQQIEITGTGSQLQGVGRLPDGRVVFVPGAIPGETVDIEILTDKGRFCEASLCDVKVPSPDRVTPDCPHAGVCGGCQARHMRYTRTLQFKRQQVIDALEHIGGVKAPAVYETLGCARPDRTRNKAEYPIAVVDGRARIGAYACSSREIIPLDDCLSQSTLSIRAMNACADVLNGCPEARHFRFLVTRVSRAGKLMVILCGDAPMRLVVERFSPALTVSLPELWSLWYCQLNRRFSHALDGTCTRIWGAQTLSERLLGLDYEVSPQSFFQVNTEQSEVLYSRALEAAGIAPGCGLKVLDAYCGTGTITLCAARWADSAVGIEIVPPAIEDANRNAERNGLRRKARFICGDAAKEIPRLLARGERFDAAILDPPRKGAEESLLSAIAAARIPTISYVSCNPATLARDVKFLSMNGYRFESAQPVDMFPWTGHIESVVKLTRAGL